jgi:hypothetical protein
MQQQEARANAMVAMAVAVTRCFMYGVMVRRSDHLAMNKTRNEP